MEHKRNITLHLDLLNGKSVIMLKFQYDNELVQHIKNINGTCWSSSKKSWYIKKDDFHLPTVFDALKSFAFINYSSLKEKHTYKPHQKNKKKIIKTQVCIPKEYTDLLEQRRYSQSTIATYTNYFADFIRHFKERNLNNISTEEVNQYILELIRENNISSSQQNQRINAIKFYYEKVLGREKQYIQINRPKKTKTLPNVLSSNEVKLLIDKTKNIKHKCIISLLYSGGLRRSELINLQITDILSEQMLIKIRNSKGNKDRYVGLSMHLLELLRNYYKEYKPKKLLIEGPLGGKYSGESIVKVVRNASKRAGIRRRITPHMLRHSFATHHLESGTDLRYIQEFLGHNSSKTTEIYTHVAKTDISKFKNPLDELYKK